MIYDKYIQYYTIYDPNLPDRIQLYKNDILDILSHIDPNYDIYINVSPGWIPLIVNLHKQILSILPNYKIHQIKEKFGALRYYIDEHTDLVWDFIYEAENLSAITCDICSQPGKLIKFFARYSTRCDQCANL